MTILTACRCLLMPAAILLLTACSDSDSSGEPDLPALPDASASGDSPAADDSGSIRADIVDTAIADGSFDTLVTALQVTGLDAVLGDDERRFTVFAPTDEAFAELGQATIDTLLNDVDTLRDLLLYHVIADSEINAETAISLAGTTVTMANEDEAALSLNGDELLINDARVTATDITTGNGIIHVIDTVLAPHTDEESSKTVAEIASSDERFTTLTTALQATGLDTILADVDSEFTVFAPTNDAFNALGQDVVDALLADTDTLREILLYHVLDGKTVDSVTATSLAGGTVDTATGESVAISVRDDQLFINDSRVTVADIRGSNGIIHAIDAVLTPPSMQAPGTIVDVASQAGFSTFIAALEATGLDEVLENPDGVNTVFAPTDEAFALLGDETVAALLADPDLLSNILLYHVLPDQSLDAAAVQGLIGIHTRAANGDFIEITQRDDGLFINESRIVQTDIVASNGVIHVIDSVLMPPVDH